MKENIIYNMENKVKSYKGQIQNLTSTFLLFAVLVIVVAVAGLIGVQTLSQVQTISGSTTNPAYLAVNATLTAIKQLTDWFPIVVVVVIGSLLLALVMGAFRPRM